MANLVVAEHSLRVAIVDALTKAIARRRDDALALSAAVRAVLHAKPEMDIAEAYELVNRLWAR